MRKVLALLVAGASAFACGSDVTTQIDSGGSTAPDGGLAAGPDIGPHDADTRADAGMLEDGGGAQDTGPNDGGTPVRSPGCGMAQTPGQYEHNIMVGSQMRTYYLSIPTGYDSNTVHPLVFGFHGLTGTGMTIRTRGVEMEEAMNTAVFVYPDGLPQPNFQNLTGWDLDPAGNDFAYFDALLEAMASEFCIDEHRVFAYGFSFGAMFSDSLGCYRSQKVLGIGADEGMLTMHGPCTGSTAAVMIHTDDDPTVSITQGRAARDHYLMANGCDPNASMAIAPSPCITYLNCQPGRPVVWCELPTGGHNWVTPPANEAIWGLFTSLE
jgi:poly(3-hydroxybutyrate) depolymerase